MRRLGFVVMSLVSALAALTSPAQGPSCDGQWLYGPEQALAGTDGSILATAAWDPDGVGPRSAVLIAGGMFTVAGQAMVSNIAQWDGTAWRPLVDGVNGAVRALAVYHGEVVAAGDFTSAGGVTAAGIAPWNGESLRALGAGLTPVPGFHTAAVLGVLDDELIVGGRFTGAGGVDAQNIAGWDGAAWSALGTGLAALPAYQPGSEYTPVMALSTYNGQLVVGGRFYLPGGDIATLARWTGAAWTPIAPDPGPGAEVHAIAGWNGDLIVGGRFGTSEGEEPLAVARWDGSWHAMGRRLWAAVNGRPDVRQLLLRDGELYIAGDFYTHFYDGAMVARWDGTEWVRVGADGLSVEARSLSVFGGELVAAGMESFESRNILSWDGAGWRTLGGGIGVILKLCEYGGDLIGGGQFHAPAQALAESLGRWDGAAWESFQGAGYDGVSRMLVHNGDLIATGMTNFFCEEGVSNAIGRWDGAAWHRLGGPGITWGLLGGPVPLATLGTDLIVGGDFTSISGVAANGVARWDGSAWHEFGGGLPGQVTALCAYRGHLIAAGEFVSAGGQPALHIAEWDGAAWRAMAGGLNAAPTCLLVWNDQLYAGGPFSRSGAVNAVGVARWDGAAWSGLGPSGLAIVGSVWDMTVYDNELIIGGSFVNAGSVSALNIARWNGTGWRSLGAGLSLAAGMNSRVTGLCVHNGQLIAAGNFTRAGGQVSAFWARWAAPSADFNHDGDGGTDPDIAAFFACLAGDCCAACGSADINADGDAGTDADIEAFFRVLSGGSC